MRHSVTHTGLGCFALGLLINCGAFADVLAPPAFGTATRVDELGNNGDLSQDVPNSISLDGLRMVLTSNRDGGHFELFLATRPDINSPFGTPSDAPFVNINRPTYQVHSGVISPNGLELFYTSRESGAVIHRATRGNTSQPFGSPVALTGLGTGSDYRGVEYMSADGLRLYLADDAAGGGMRVASRPDLSSPFGVPSGSMFVNVAPTEEYYLSHDERHLFYNPGPLSMAWSFRLDPTSPFDPVVDLPTITAVGESLSPVLAGDQLFFNHAGDIWTATALSPIPEPSSVLLLAAAALIVPRRRLLMARR